MTYSNSGFNPLPEANPFNTRLGPSNWCLNPAGASYRPNVYKSDSNAKLPEPVMLGQNFSSELHTPDTTPPFNFRLFLADIDLYSRDKSWNNSSIYDDIIANTLGYTGGMSRKDIEYWNKANIESAKLSANMSDEQKQMMEEVDKMFPPSKLEDIY